MIGGKYVLLMSDAMEGYIPSLKWFFDTILDGKKISYTWSIYLGINSYINMSGMSLFSVSTPIYLLFHNFDYAYVTALVLILKAGISSMAFFTFAHKTLGVKENNAVFFGMLYSMCGFQVSYIPILLHFADAIFMLPIILLLISEYADNGKYRVMCLAYIYVFLNFYYTGYIIGFFSLFYLLLYMFIIKRYSIKTILFKLLFLGLCIIITAGTLAIILYPTAYYLLTKYSEDATKLSYFGGVFFHDIYNQLFIGKSAGIRSEYPYIYCGLPTLLLLPFYFTNNKINRNEKFIYIILIVLMMASCFVPIIYLFWHCFDAPDGFSFRFSFIISFLFCVIAARQSEFIEQIKKMRLFFIVLINIIIYYLCIFIQPLFQEKYNVYPKNTWTYLLINAIFLFLYFFWGIIYDKNKKVSNKKNMYAVIMLLATCEVVINGYSSFFESETINPTYYAGYKYWENSMQSAIDAINQDGKDFYRVICENDYITNSPIFWGYNGVTTFSNVENYKVRKALRNLGIETSTRTILSRGFTDFTKMILDVEYSISGVKFPNSDTSGIDYNQELQVFRVDPHLAIGFLVEDDIINFQFSGNNQFVNINELASCMTGEKCEIYENYNEEPLFEELGISIVHDDDGKTRYFLNDNDYDRGALLISIPASEKAAFVEFDYGSSVLDYSAPIFYNPGNGDWNYDDRISVQCIIPMAHIQDWNIIGILIDDEMYDNVYAPDHIYFAYYNYEEIGKVYNKLKAGQMTEIDYGNGWVNGHVDVDENEKVLFTSIPYDEGWEIIVNGVKTEPLMLLDGAFIGLKLPRGSYDIEFRYHVPGLKTGIIITFISIILMIALFIINPKMQVKIRSEKSVETE